jgi:hypothetical protein
MYPASREFTVTLQVVDPIDFACNIDAHVRAMLAAEYVGACHMGSFVLAVEDVLETSDVALVAADGGARGYVNVRWRASAVTYGPWDVIAPARLVEAAPLPVAACAPELALGPAGRSHGAPAAASLAAGSLTDALAPGMIFAVRVIEAEHGPRAREVAAYAVPLAADRAAPAFVVRGGLGPGDAAALAPLLAAVDAERAARTSAPELADARAFFDGLLHSRAVAGDGGGAPASAPAPPGEVGTAVDVVEFVRDAIRASPRTDASGVWSRPLRLARGGPLALKSPRGTAADAEAPAATLFAEYLRAIAGWLAAARALAEAFPTESSRTSQRAFWAAMRSHQQPEK